MQKDTSKITKSRAPLRIGLSGGGTDIEDYYREFPGAVINTTISIYAYAEIKETGENEFKATSLDHKITNSWGSFARAEIEDIDRELKLHVAANKRIAKTYMNKEFLPCHLSTYCDAPIGSGLGSSSSLVVAIIKAFDEHFKIGLDKIEIAELAYKIERKDCKISGGKQDHYSATFGGFNCINFFPTHCVIRPLDIKDWFIRELETTTLLHFTGISRASSEIIEDQKLLSTKAHEKIRYLHAMKDEVDTMKTALLICDRSSVEDSLKRSWELKRNTSDRISSPDISNLIERGYELGATAAKVSGAGGGGYIMFMSESDKAISLKNELIKYNHLTYFAKFTKYGVEAWSKQR